MDRYFQGCVGRNATAEEMAEPLIFLNSNMARYISGQNICIDYGWQGAAEMGKQETDVVSCLRYGKNRARGLSGQSLKQARYQEVCQMTAGYMDRILLVNLSTGEIEEETPPESLYRDFLCWYGLGARIIFGSDFMINLMSIDSCGTYMKYFAETLAFTAVEKDLLCSKNTERFLFLGIV